MPPVPLEPPPMPAPIVPPVTVSAPAASLGALVMEIDALAGTSRPAWSLPEASVFVPARKSEISAFCSNSKTHWPLPVVWSVKSESVTALVAPAETTTSTLPAVFAPESVRGSAPESVSVGALYVQPVPPDETASSRAVPLTVTPVGAALVIVANTMNNAVRILLRLRFFMAVSLVVNI